MPKLWMRLALLFSSRRTELENYTHLPRLGEQLPIRAPDLAVLFEIAALDGARRKFYEHKRIRCKTRQRFGRNNMNC